MRKIRLGSLLLYTAALFQATQFARVYHLVDRSSALSEIGGFLAGAVVNISLAYSATRLPRIRAKKARILAYLSFAMLIVVTPLFLAPMNYVTMGDTWDNAILIKAMIATLAASIVDIAIALVAFSDGTLMPAEQPAGQGATQGQETPARQPRKGKPLPQEGNPLARKPVTDDDVIAYISSNPGASHQEIANAFGVSRQAIGQRLNRILKTNQLTG